jgi:hypothetical protein
MNGLLKRIISSIERGFDGESAAPQHMPFDRLRAGFVSEEFLYGADTCPEPQVLGIVTVLEEANFFDLAFIVEEDVAVNPFEAGLFSAKGVMLLGESHCSVGRRVFCHLCLTFGFGIL